MSDWRGVVLAGGKGTRLGQLTRVVNKHLLPVGPYPMIYYPIRKLVLAQITDILLVSSPEHLGDFVKLLGSGRDLGCKLTYRAQDEPGGIAQALGLAGRFCDGSPCMVMLGDNILQNDVMAGTTPADMANIYLKEVTDPRGYGVAEVVDRRVVSIEEKPAKPKSNYAVVGAYQYPPDVFEVIRTMKPSARGELEITDVNRHYLKQGRLMYDVLGGYWTDAGTPETYAEANRLVNETPPRF